jgi:hypothetical protein
MTTKQALWFGVAMIGLGAGMAPALADETGFAYAHDLSRVGGKLCMTDHYHYGNGTGSTKAAAQRDAISSWASFTDFEYGSDWARFGKAIGKRISCSGSAGSYSCQVEARPCR